MMTLSKNCISCGQLFEISSASGGNGIFARIAFRQDKCQPCVDKALAEFQAQDKRTREASAAFHRREMLANSGTPLKFQADAERLDGFDPTGNQGSYKKVLAYVERFPKNERPINYPSMIIYGRHNGIGKTRLSCGIIRCLIDAWTREEWNKSPYQFVAMPDLRLQLQMGLRFQAERTTEAVYRDCAQAWLLVLDDVGKESQYRADDAEVYFKLINDRYNNQLPTIITSNLAPDAPWVKGGLSLTDVMGLATMSRLREMCSGSVIEIKGEDRR